MRVSDKPAISDAFDGDDTFLASIDEEVSTVDRHQVIARPSSKVARKPKGLDRFKPLF